VLPLHGTPQHHLLLLLLAPVAQAQQQQLLPSWLPQMLPVLLLRLRVTRVALVTVQRQ
jgi:hypothetical protein